MGFEFEKLVLINLGLVLFIVLYKLQIGADRLAEETVGGKDGPSIGERNNSQQMSHGSVPKHSEYKPKNRQEWHSHGGIQEVPIKLQEPLDPFYMYIYIYIYIYVCMYVCMYVFTYVVFSIALY